MISIATTGPSFDQLRASVNGVEKDFKRNVATAINATARKAKSGIAKSITSELATSQKVVKGQLRSSKASAGKLGATVTLYKSNRISLRDFGARQNKVGVSYRISKTEGRKTVPGAFQGPRPGAVKASWRGNVFKRVGAARLPIQKLQGPSPWGVFVKRKMTRQQTKDINDELAKQIERRIRFLTLKAQGKI